MATIQNAIQSYNMMSLQYSSVIEKLYTLKQVSSEAIDVSSLVVAQRELQHVEVSFNQIELEIRKANKEQEKLNKNIDNASKPANKLLGTLGTIAKSYLSLQQVGNVLSLSDDMANTYAQLELMNDGKTTTPELQQMIFDTAQSTYTPYQATADMVAKLGMQEATPFENNAQIVDFVEQVNKSLAVSGTPQGDINTVMQQLTQSMTGGSIQPIDLKDILTKAPSIAANIQTYLEEEKNIENASNLYELAKNGEITGETIKNAMLYAADETNAAFESMPVTWSQLWTNFQTGALMAFNEVLMELNNIANSEKFQSFISGVIQSLNILAQVVLGVINAISTIGGFLYENWSYVEPVIVAATFALIAYGAAQLWVNRQAIINTARTVVQTILKWAYVIATIAQIAATYGLTGAMMALGVAIAANPIGWLIGAIVALVLIFYAAVAAVNHFTGKSYSATGLIAGAFFTLGAIIANIFFGIIQIVLGIIEALFNHWVAFANFFGNVFNDPIGAIIHLFGDLADNVLGVIEKIASALDFVFGTDFATTVAGWREDLSGLVDWAAEEYGNGQYEVLREELDTDKVMSDLGIELERMEYSNAWKAGNDWGANLFNFDKQEDDSQQKEQEAQVQAIMDSLGTGNNIANNTAENTGKFADSVEMAGEDLVYLKDLAEREVINRYTTAQIKVDMRNENYINSEMDIDGVINRFGERAEEAADMLAEGGYSYV